MTEKELYSFITSSPLGTLIDAYPLAVDFFGNLRIRALPPDMTLPCLIDTLDDAMAEEFGIQKQDIPLQLWRFLTALTQSSGKEDEVSSLTILGGHNKYAEAEDIAVTFRKGEVAAIVGPTGSGKSRLLADIECLAQRDTPTGRLILVNGREVGDEGRFEMDGKLVAQLSQNMNFVMDLTVREFLEMHARSRMSLNVEETITSCLTCANSLAGERFDDVTKVTQLSGGQSRALMIADTAYMSSSPVVLIDEIENAGIDRKRAVTVLTKSDKIVLIATHDPLIALGADKRLVIKNGGIVKVIETTPKEQFVLRVIESMDATVQQLRNRLRAGEIITEI